MDTSSAPDRHIDFLDGFRGLAAMLVVISHFGNRTLIDSNADGILSQGLSSLDFAGFQVLSLAALSSGLGQVGVMLFFALSAFLMFHLYADTPPTGRAIRNFLAGRVARIFPLYYFALALALATSLFLPFTFINIPLDAYPAHLVFVQGNSVLWTIAPELLFYLIFALTWLALGKNIKFLLIPAIIFVLIANQLPIIWKSYSAEFFVIGYLVYMCRKYDVSFGLNRLPSILPLLMFAVILFFHLPAVRKILIGEAPLGGWESLSYAAAVFALFMLVFEGRWLQALFRSRVMAFLGQISFSVYLLHLFVLHGLLHYDLIGPDFVSLALALGLIVAFSSLTFFLIEKPARHWLKAKLSATGAPASATVKQPARAT